MIIPEGYVEVSLDGLIEFSRDDYFFKRMMEMIPPATREKKKNHKEASNEWSKNSLG